MNTTDRELQFVRVFNAPRELVFNVWTQPSHVVQWWGPTGFTTTIHEMDVRPGGVWRFMMHGPDGTDYPNKIVFKKVVKPEYLEFVQGWDNDKPDFGDFEVTVHFKELSKKQTELTMRMVFKAKKDLDMAVEKFGAIEGHRQTMNRLEHYLHKFEENS